MSGGNIGLMVNDFTFFLDASFDKLRRNNPLASGTGRFETCSHSIRAVFCESALEDPVV